MDITNSNLFEVHKSYYDMCVVHDVVYQLLNYPFFKNGMPEHSSKQYPKQLINVMEDMGIYDKDVRLFTTFQVLRQLQPMTKSYSFPAYYSVNEQAKILLEMLDYVIPRISFINGCNNIEDVEKLKPMNRLRFEKMVKSRLNLATAQLMEANFIKYTKFKEKYGFINDKNIQNIHEQIAKVFNALDVKFQHDPQLIDTSRQFDEIAKELNEKQYQKSLKYARKKQIKQKVVNHKHIILISFICLFIGFLILILTNK